METRKNYRAIRLIPIVLIIAILGITLAQSFVIVSAGNRGVVITLGKVTGLLGEGFNFKTPWLTSVEIVDVRVRAAERNGESAGTKDLQEVTADITVNYRLAPDKVDEIFVNLGRGYETSVILPNVDESLKAVTAQFTAEELITRRDTVKVALTDNLQSRLAVFDIEVITVSFTDFQFSAQFTAAIEAKVTAQQKALEAQNKLEQVRFEEQQKVIQAQAEANATITRVSAEAQARLIQSAAEAEAIRVVREQLGLSPTAYTDYLAIQKWDGVLPYLMGSGALPFINVNATRP